jgi:hypothetical protein
MPAFLWALVNKGLRRAHTILSASLLRYERTGETAKIAKLVITLAGIPVRGVLKI